MLDSLPGMTPKRKITRERGSMPCISTGGCYNGISHGLLSWYTSAHAKALQTSPQLHRQPHTRTSTSHWLKFPQHCSQRHKGPTLQLAMGSLNFSRFTSAQILSRHTVLKNIYSWGIKKKKINKIWRLKNKVGFYFFQHTDLNWTKKLLINVYKRNLFTRVPLIRQSVKTHSDRGGSVWMPFDQIAQRYRTIIPPWSRNPRKAPSPLQKAEGTSFALGFPTCLNFIFPPYIFLLLDWHSESSPSHFDLLQPQEGRLTINSPVCTYSRNLISTIKPFQTQNIKWSHTSHATPW